MCAPRSQAARDSPTTRTGAPRTAASQRSIRSLSSRPDEQDVAAAGGVRVSAGVTRTIGRPSIDSPAIVRSTAAPNAGSATVQIRNGSRGIRRRPFDELGEIEEERRLDVVLGRGGALLGAERRAGEAGRRARRRTRSDRTRLSSRHRTRT